MRIYMDGTDMLEHLTAAGDPIAAGHDRDAGCLRLARWLGRYCEHRDCDAVLVFDGVAPGERLTPRQRVGRVTVINTPCGIEARAEIAGPANRSAGREPTLVVTGDYGIVGAMGRSDARVRGPKDFMTEARRHMGRQDDAAADEPDAKFVGLSDGDVEYWLHYFEQDN